MTRGDAVAQAEADFHNFVKNVLRYAKTSANLAYAAQLKKRIDLLRGPHDHQSSQ